MKTIEETRRGMFEAWMRKNGMTQHHPAKQDMWLGFNAALDAVVIELPAMHVAGEMSGACVLASCKQAIESTNLGLKIR